MNHHFSLVAARCVFCRFSQLLVDKKRTLPWDCHIIALFCGGSHFRSTLFHIPFSSSFTMSHTKFFCFYCTWKTWSSPVSLSASKPTNNTFMMFCMPCHFYLFPLPVFIAIFSYRTFPSHKISNFIAVFCSLPLPRFLRCKNCFCLLRF